MKKNLYFTIGLLLGFAAAASAGGIRTSSSPYGNPSSSTPVVDGDVTEQDYAFSFLGGYQVFDFLVNTDIGNFTLTLTGDAPFLADDTADIPPEYFGFGAFVPNNNSCATGGQCGPDPNLAPYNASASLGSSDGTATQVTFTVAGDGKGLVFFAIEPETNGVNNFVTAQISPITAAPEPSFWPVLALLFLGLGVGLRRRRSTTLAEPVRFLGN